MGRGSTGATGAIDGFSVVAAGVSGVSSGAEMIVSFGAVAGMVAFLPIGRS